MDYGRREVEERWEGLVAYSGNVLVSKSEEKRSLGNPSCRW